ncbi:hypothetical protein LTR36_009444 [Oleoguttula mirabilis]|uniref:Uncharacterized protein n=1 Tax=Oleoguttula mirabilis TaxID=1507867 RepID=A0AAV9JSP4_9PEZI|nr:hypothetical protein LTR36_009444 [Oleoguttula mirabilis]
MSSNKDTPAGPPNAPRRGDLTAANLEEVQRQQLQRQQHSHPPTTVATPATQAKPAPMMQVWQGNREDWLPFYLSNGGCKE